MARFQSDIHVRWVGDSAKVHSSPGEGGRIARLAERVKANFIASQIMHYHGKSGPERVTPAIDGQDTARIFRRRNIDILSYVQIKCVTAGKKAAKSSDQ